MFNFLFCFKFWVSLTTEIDQVSIWSNERAAILLSKQALRHCCGFIYNARDEDAFGLVPRGFSQPCNHRHRAQWWATAHQPSKQRRALCYCSINAEITESVEILITYSCYCCMIVFSFTSVGNDELEQSKDYEIWYKFISWNINWKHKSLLMCRSFCNAWSVCVLSFRSPQFTTYLAVRSEPCNLEYWWLEISITPRYLAGICKRLGEFTIDKKFTWLQGWRQQLANDATC